MTEEPDPDQPSSEEKMRRAFEARRGARFSDEEWDEAKRNLVSLFLSFGIDDGPASEDDRPE